MVRFAAAQVLVVVCVAGCRTTGDDATTSGSSSGNGASSSSSTSSNGGSSGSTSSSSGGMDGGITDAGGGDGGPVVGAAGAACRVNAECESNYCFRPYGAQDIGTGYCSAPCDTVEDCTLFHTDDYLYSCLRAGSRKRCIRSCDDGRDCPNQDYCGDVAFALGSNPGITTFGACFSFADDACTADRDCTDGKACFPTYDYHRFHLYCGTPQSPGKPQGASCTPGPNPPCATAADCPMNWTCDPVGPGGRRLCVQPVAEQCAHGCALLGECNGYCNEDSDCSGTANTCSFSRYRILHQQTNTNTDDLDVPLGGCFPAPDAPESCTSSAACVSHTVDGGPESRCYFSVAMDGTVEQACYSIDLPIAHNGEPCGDDFSTYPQVEARICPGACVAGLCGDLCQTNAECLAGWNCEDVASGTASLRACVRQATCTGDGVDGGCAADEACKWASTGRRTLLTCHPVIGDKQTGAPCEAVDPSVLPRAERCVGTCGAFRDGSLCSHPCTAEVDCPTGWGCLAYSFVLDNRGTADLTDDVTGQDSICAPKPGSGMSCARPSECPAGESCVLSNFVGATPGICLTDKAGGAALGAECGTGCASAMCNTRARQFNRGYCSEVCAQDADCPSPLVCRKYRTGLAVPDATASKRCVEPGDESIIP